MRLLGLIVTFAALLVTSCRQSTPPADFTYINGPEPESLDPAIITGQAEGRLCDSLYEGLVMRNRNGIASPGIAESWTISPDGKTYTFHLRESVWSNGEPLTAHDYARSWARALSPALASSYAELLYPIRNAELFNRGKIDNFSEVGVKAADSHTLVVTLENPTPYFIDLCTMPTLYPVYFPTLKEYPDSWMKPGRLVSNGAYVLEDWRLEDCIRLRKNPRYWRKETVAFERVAALSVTSATTAFNLFYSGKVDLIMDKSNIPPLYVPHLRKTPYYHANPFLASYFYRFNVTRKPFNDARVRKAFALAIDKPRIVEKITRAGEPPANSITPPGVKDYTPPKGLSMDPQKAKALLAEAGFPNGKGFPPVSLLYNSTELNEQVAVEVQSMWHDTLGVSVTLRKQDWKVYLNSLDHLDFDIARSSWVGDYNDANTFLDCFITGRGNNRTGWSHAPYDRLMEESRKESDPTLREQRMQAAERLLIEDEIPIVPLYFFVGMALYHDDKLEGFSANVVDVHPIRELSWRKKP